MKLDKEKKYRFAGDVYERGVTCWASSDVKYAWTEGHFQFFADRGVVEEVREPLRRKEAE